MPQFCILFYAKYTILATQRGMAQCPPLNTPLGGRLLRSPVADLDGGDKGMHPPHQPKHSVQTVVGKNELL